MLTWTSCLSEYMDPFCQQLTILLARQADRPTKFFAGDWGLRQDALAAGQIDGGFICGLLHVDRRANGWAYEPLVAPLMAGEAADGLPLYASELLVLAEAPYRKMADLRGTTLAINEVQSFTGYHMLCQALGGEAMVAAFFGKRHLSGSHWRSLACLQQGVAACATIDSTLLDMLARREPERLTAFRSLRRLGPYPAPPFVIARHHSPNTKAALRRALLTLADDPEGQQLLEAWGIQKFLPVDDAFYQPIADLGITLAWED